MDIISDDGASSSSIEYVQDGGFIAEQQANEQEEEENKLRTQQICTECKEHYIDCQCATIERDFEFRQAKNELNALCDFIARTNTPNEEIEERVKLLLTLLYSSEDGENIQSKRTSSNGTL